MGEYCVLSGVILVGMYEFGVDVEVKNLFGFCDLILQLMVVGVGVELQLGQECVIVLGEFIFGENSEIGVLLLILQFEVFGCNGSFVVLWKYDSWVGVFNDFFCVYVEGEEVQYKLVVKMFGCWCLGVLLLLLFDYDDEVLGVDLQCSNDFLFKDDVVGFVCFYVSYMWCMNLCDS